MATGKQQVNIALGGGGVRGVGLVGALVALDEAGFAFEQVVGTSSGAVVGAFLAALVQGRKPVSDLVAIMNSFEPAKLGQRWPVGHVPVAGDALSLLVDGAVYQDRYLRHFVAVGLKALGVEKFGDLVVRTDAEPARRYRLALTTTDLTLRRGAVLPWDLSDYGVDPDDYLVVDAVLASAAIPFVFPAQKLGRSVLVDGGVLEDLPIGVLDANTPQPALVANLAVSLGALATSGRRPDNLFAQSIALVETLLAGAEARHIAEPCTAERIITVPAAGVSPLDFDMTSSQHDELVQAGQEAARSFAATWDFATWQSRCAPRQPSGSG